MASSASLSPTPPPRAARPRPAVKPAPSFKPESLKETVDGLVEHVVNEAVTRATLKSEKARVQTLINNLVTRVQSDSAAATKAQTPSMQGVAIGDHRLRRIADTPLTWTQTMDSLTLNIHVPDHVRKEHISIHFDSNSIAINIRSPHAHAQQPYFNLDRKFVADIDVAGCMWGLEAASLSRKLIVEVEKSKVQWWARLFSTDDVADYSIVAQNHTFVNGESSETVAETTHTTTTTPLSARSVVTSEPQRAPSADKPSQESDSAENDLKQSVESVVNNIVEEVTKDTTAPSREPRAPQGQRNQRPTTTRKMLTRADLPKLVEEYRNAFKQGGRNSVESALQLATFYHHGVGVKQDDAEAVKLYRYALENGALDPSAAFQLGLIYNQGAPGVEPNPEEAVRWWKLSAGLGNPVAMFNLGVMFLNGSGCDLDPELAQQWFERAHAINPQLKPPQLTKAQFAERMATAAKIRRERMRRELPPEEKMRRKELALQKVRYAAYGTMAVAGISASLFALRYWWHNRL
ncbi:sel1 repeat family protein [Gracilaria domingensis]|nr:sel1 repeat family protein [Gracilaria domingensis]